MRYGLPTGMTKPYAIERVFRESVKAVKDSKRVSAERRRGGTSCRWPTRKLHQRSEQVWPVPAEKSRSGDQLNERIERYADTFAQRLLVDRCEGKPSLLKRRANNLADGFYAATIQLQREDDRQHDGDQLTMFDYDTYTELKRGTVSRDEMTIAPKNNFTNIPRPARTGESRGLHNRRAECRPCERRGRIGRRRSRDVLAGPDVHARKQTGSDRRFGKSLQRDLLGTECTMQVNGMCQDCVECILYGSAASDDADQQLSITSRVMYDTAYTLRDATAAIDEKFQNAPGDDYAKTAEATIREPDFFEPGTLFPSVITLRDATPEELAFVLGVTAKNKRYGAATSRLGRVKNHVLGVYTGSEEGPANLRLTLGASSPASERQRRNDCRLDPGHHHGGGTTRNLSANSSSPPSMTGSTLSEADSTSSASRTRPSTICSKPRPATRLLTSSKRNWTPRAHSSNRLPKDMTAALEVTLRTQGRSGSRVARSVGSRIRSHTS